MQRNLAVRLFQWRSRETAEVFEKHIPLICPSHVVIEFGEPFIVKELDPENRKFVGAYTREKIAGMLSEMEKENN